MAACATITNANSDADQQRVYQAKFREDLFVEGEGDVAHNALFGRHYGRDDSQGFGSGKIFSCREQ